MRNLYICQTMYQTLIALLKMDFQKDTLLLMNLHIEYPHLKNIANVTTLFLDDVQNYGLRSILKRKETKEKLAFLQSFDNIYLFLDHREVGVFLNKHRIPYVLLEDAYNFFRKHYYYDLKYVHTSFLKRTLYAWYFRPTYFVGSSPYCQYIEVNDVSIIPKDERFKPFKELPRAKLFANLSEEKKKAVFYVFQAENLTFSQQKAQDKKKLLLLTQPLHWDYKITPEEIFQMYADCLKAYEATHSLYIKVHPRDTQNYEKLAPNLHFLPKGIPMELFELGTDLQFDIGITYDSTALNYLSCVKEKRFLEQEKKLQKLY